MKKDNMIKDAIILCVITLILGAVLAGVYAITKDRIDTQQAEANNKACEAVVADGDSVQPADSGKLAAAQEYLKSHDISKVEGFALGVTAGEDGTPVITGISITSQAETAGLGANCENEDWQNSFKGKKLPESASDNMYNKTQESETQVQALSGATVTSRAITNAVKGILFVASSEGGAVNE